MHYKNRLIHAAHQNPSQNSKEETVMGQARIKVRQGLKLKCYICNQLQATVKKADLACLDQLTPGVAQTTTKGNTNRVEGTEARGKSRTSQPVSGNPDSCLLYTSPSPRD